MAAPQASAVGVARQAEALHRRFVLIDHEGEAAELPDRGRIARERENIVAADRRLPRAGSFDSTDRAVRPGISEVELQPLGIAIFNPRRIEGLLILPPTGGANEALILDVDPL